MMCQGVNVGGAEAYDRPVSMLDIHQGSQLLNLLFFGCDISGLCGREFTSGLSICYKG